MILSKSFDYEFDTDFLLDVPAGDLFRAITMYFEPIIY